MFWGEEEEKSDDYTHDNEETGLREDVVELGSHVKPYNKICMLLWEEIARFCPFRQKTFILNVGQGIHTTITGAEFGFIQDILKKGLM